MKKTASLFTKVIFVGAFVVAGAIMLDNIASHNADVAMVPNTQYGAFLAAQHAIYVNDFDAAKEFANELTDVDIDTVNNLKYMSAFLGGNLPDGASELKKESGTPARLIYDAYLVNNDKWDEMYSRHKNDKSALAAPLRIWASVAIDHKTEALKFMDSLQTSDSWKSFVRGQIYAETGDVSKAAAAFSGIQTSFLNINDYLYIMSFYSHNDMEDLAEKLRDEFTAQPGGMFMGNFKDIPDWSQYAGIKNALAFSLIQNVSHTQVMMYSDLSALLLRFAQVTGKGSLGDSDAINYYLGQYFFNNGGDYNRFFTKIKPSSPYYPFAMLRIAEGAQDVMKLHRVLRAYPTFVPAMNRLISYYIANGDRRSALKIVNRALKNRALSDENHAFFLKIRARIYFAFNNLDRAQSDIRAASDVLETDGEILALQAKIWAKQNREIETAYEYAMALVKQNPSDVFAWDVLGRVVAAREGVFSALDFLARVGAVAKTCSALFETLGDLYAEIGNDNVAVDAYLRAIELSDDGMVVVPYIQQKLRKVK